MKILFFKIGALGDTLMTTPLLRQARKNYPEATIDYLVGEKASVALADNEYVDEVFTFDEAIFFKKKLLKLMGLVGRVRKKDYDVIFVLDKHWFFNLCSKLFGVKERAGFDRRGEGKFLTHKVPYEEVRHEIKYYLDLLDAYGGEVDYSDFSIDLEISKSDKTKAEKLLKKHKLKKYVVIVNSGGNNPGEEGLVRKMPDSLFSGIVERISKDSKIVFVGSKAEKKYYDNFKGKNVFNFAGKTSIKESAYVMKKANLILTTDCGPMHMASAVNDNIVAIFGPTNPERKKPLNHKVKTIWKDKKIYEEDYEIYGKAPASSKKWFRKIKPEDVLKCMK